MIYSEFKTYLTTFLWKQNDADLVANLDNLIRMAHGELNRVLDIQRRQKTVVIEPTTQDFALPSDFRHIGSVNNNSLSSRSMFLSTTLSDIYATRQRYGSDDVAPMFAVDEGVAGIKLLRLVGPFSVENPGDLTLVYRCNVPDFQFTNGSWLETDFLDLYTYTVLSHTAPFLREDERIQVWQALKAEAIVSAITEDKHQITHGGSPMQMRPHRPVP